MEPVNVFELSCMAVALGLLSRAVPGSSFNLIVCTILSWAYWYTPVDDMTQIMHNDDALLWSGYAALLYIAYLMVDIVKAADDDVLLHHTVALLAFSSNLWSAWGRTVLMNIFILEFSTVLLCIRCIVREPPRKPAWIRKAVDAAFIPVYLVLRGYMFPMRMYALFFESLPSMPPELAPARFDLLIGSCALIISIVLNYYWCYLIVSILWRKILRANNE